MEVSIWIIWSKEDEKLGLIKTETYLDIIDVNQRAKNSYNDDFGYVEYIGNLEL